MLKPLFEGKMKNKKEIKLSPKVTLLLNNLNAKIKVLIGQRNSIVNAIALQNGLEGELDVSEDMTTITLKEEGEKDG